MKIVKYVLASFAIILAGAILLFFPDGSNAISVDVDDDSPLVPSADPVNEKENEPENKE
jgi:hypothetical protein